MVTNDVAAADERTAPTAGEAGRSSGQVAQGRDALGAALVDELAEQLAPGLQRIDPLDGRLNGFGGLHGGVVAAACIEASRGDRDMDDDWEPVAAHVDFVKAIRGAADVGQSMVHSGRRSGLSTVSITDSKNRTVLATSSVRWGRNRQSESAVAPLAPADITPIEDCDEFVVPPEFVPIAPMFRIFPAAGALPYSGASDPRLCAWVQLRRSAGRVDQLTAAEIAIVADSLAPSVAATFTELLTAPTVSMGISFYSQGDDGANGSRCVDPSLVLVDARSTLLGGGWVEETIRMWTDELHPLAVASQVRLITARV